MITTPAWALTLAYWLHMLATVVWIGGLATLSILVIPALRRTLEPPAYAALLSALQRRLDPLAWFSLALLVGTGMIQMSANPNYTGFLEIKNTWAAAILIKHLVIIGMVAISAYLTWGLFPRLRRLALLQSHGRETGSAESLRRQEILLIRLNLVLGVLVLTLTAVARAAN